MARGPPQVAPGVWGNLVVPNRNLNQSLPSANQAESTFDILFRRFGGTLFVPFVDAAAIAGMAPSTVRNSFHAGKCPFPTVKIGGRRQVCLLDLANWIDDLREVRRTSQTNPPAVTAPTPKHRPGRPRKSAAVVEGIA